jgi:hypothetical protein
VRVRRSIDQRLDLGSTLVRAGDQRFMMFE